MLSLSWDVNLVEYGILAISLSATIFMLVYFKTWHLITRDSHMALRKGKVLVIVFLALFVSVNLQLWYRFTESFRESGYWNAEIPALLMTPFNVSGYSFAEANFPDLTDGFKCDTIKFTDTLSVSSPTSFGSSLKRIRDELRQLLDSGYSIAKNCFLDDKDESEADILANKWAHFCGNSVWLEEHQVHFMVSRVLYSHRRLRNRPTINMIYMQVFDKDWVEQFDVSLGSDLVFPTVLKVDIDQAPGNKMAVMGPEDPRVVIREFYKNGKLEQEPVIVFNMRSTKIKWKRAMHMSRPLSGAKTVQLALRNREPEFREKNWAPFFDKNDKKTAFFVYNFNPLRIIGCDLEDGLCDKLAGPKFGENPAGNVGSLRGGTNLVPIPSASLPPTLQNRQYWFGIARSHLSQCGCLREVYRPHLFVISKGAKDYSMDYVSSLLDFNVRPEPWDPTKSICEDGKSVLIPNSISFWDIIQHDRMGIIFSEADRTNKLIQVDGMMKHILRVLNDGGAIDDKERKKENTLLGKCSTEEASAYCEANAKAQQWFKEPKHHESHVE